MMSDSSVPSDDEIESFLGDVTITDDTFGEVSFSEAEDEIPPVTDETDITSGFEDSTVSIGDGSCSVCGAPTFRPPGLTKTGRKKRAPKYCDLHDPKRRISKEGPVFAGLESQLKKVQDELADDLRLLGVLVGPMLPVTGYFVFEHADPFTIAILKLAKNNPQVLRVLHRVAQVAPIYQVAETVAGTAYAIQVDMQKADAHSVAGQRLGVARAYDAVYPEDVQTNVSSNGTQGPPRYATA
jgi:hypothetical protein